MINTYRKRPVEIQALRYVGNNLEEVLGFVTDDVGMEITKELYIYTLEGKMKVSVGDYIIQGIRGEFYPCKPDIFVETYMLVEDTDG